MMPRILRGIRAMMVALNLDSYLLLPAGVPGEGRDEGTSTQNLPSPAPSPSFGGREGRRHHGTALVSVIMIALFLSTRLEILAHAETASPLEQQAASAWAKRADPAETIQAFKLWEQAIKADPSKKTLLLSLAHAGARITRHTDDKSQKADWAERTLEIAERSTQENPENSKAFASLGESLGQWADTHKGLGSLKKVHQAVEALKKAVTLDPNNAYAHMLLSQFYRQAPSGISVGDKAQALEEAKRAVETGPHSAINHLALAQIELDLGKKPAAIAELQTTVALPPPADAIPETRADQETARALLKTLGASPASEGACSDSVTTGCQSKNP